MKRSFFLAVAAVASLAEAAPVPFVYETPQEFFARGDFRGTGAADLVIVDKESGKYRLGYQLTPGKFSWVDCRPSGVKGITGFSVGRVLATNRDGLVFASADANEITMVDAVNPGFSSKPMTVPFSAGLGPNTVVAVPIGGPGKTGLMDLYVGTMYNSPDSYQGTLLRNDGAQFPDLRDEPLKGQVTRGNRINHETGDPEELCILISDEKGAMLRVDNLAGEKTMTAAMMYGLPVGTEYVVGKFGQFPTPGFIFYKPGAKKLDTRLFGGERTFDLGQPIRRVVVLEAAAGRQLFVIFGEGEQAGVFNFDGLHAPVPVQTIAVTNELITCAENYAGGFLVFSHPAASKLSTRYVAYEADGAGYKAGNFGGLASLADNDNIIIPDINARIVAAEQVKEESAMEAYTNTIPGTRVSYAMVPIPSGEYLMGSPEREAGRKPDEGPQHKVKISPFWMGQKEVTWNEYELFMYPDEERRTRANLPTDEAGDKLADVVTHPSKPYTEMSFGMGKDGYPAIAMTQHAANKYCQWLSAKTGHFYRLPTEAEWEYAARAGTTTAYFFGNDTNKLGEYAWYEQNSDFKYQKVGKKKPNPWGLYDIYGNVVEWVLDQYDPDFYKQSAGETTDPWNKATKPYPHSVRGGSWDDEAGMCRSAARRGSTRAWKAQDPQLPKSVWYFSDTQVVGFRFVRPLKVPTTEEMQKYWTSGVERD